MLDVCTTSTTRDNLRRASERFVSRSPTLVPKPTNALTPAPNGRLKHAASPPRSDATVAILEADHIIEVRRRRFENVDIRHGNHPVDGSGRDMKTVTRVHRDFFELFRGRSRIQ